MTQQHTDSDEVKVRGADPKCVHGDRVTGGRQGSGVFDICTECGAFIEYKGNRRARPLDAA